jgi:hypothetical protein
MESRRITRTRIAFAAERRDRGTIRRSLNDGFRTAQFLSGRGFVLQMIGAGFHLPYQVRGIQLSWSFLELRHGPLSQIRFRQANYHPTKILIVVFPSG